MTQQLNNIIVAFAVATLSMSAFATTKEAAKTESNVGTYTLDAAHSKVGFEIPHLVISTVEGRFTKFDGDFEIAKKFTDSKVTANIDINSIDTANADRDKHLKSADFLM